MQFFYLHTSDILLKFDTLIPAPLWSRIQNNHLIKVNILKNYLH